MSSSADTFSASASSALDDIAGRLARSAVEHGGSWEDVASSLGLNRQAARKAYERPRRPHTRRAAFLGGEALPAAPSWGDAERPR